MGFKDEVGAVQRRLEARAGAVHTRACELAFTSIVEGSALTGAPGQRVDTSFLKSSWQNIPIGPHLRLLATPVAYAPIFEGQPYDPRGTQRPGGMISRGPSQVGLADFSVLKTRLAWERIVAAATAEVTRG